jgi:hypothetical protein
LRAIYVRALIIGAIFGIPVSLCTWTISTMANRATAAVIATGAGPLSMGCEYLFIELAELAVIFAVAGIAAVVYCGRLVSTSSQASRVGAVAGATACIVPGAVFLVPVFQEQMSHDPNLYSPGMAHTVFAFSCIAVGMAFSGTIYLLCGSVCAMMAGTIYYGNTGKKERR